MAVCALQAKIWEFVKIRVRAVKPGVSNRIYGRGTHLSCICLIVAAGYWSFNCENMVSQLSRKQRKKKPEKPSQTASRAFRVLHSRLRSKNTACAASPVHCWMCDVGSRNERGKFVSACINNATQVEHGFEQR